ncbi:class I SAM-dependent DNA methyltransferase [Streptomyces sp. NPDC050658]|uniref:class I SAM-dependent DNA methyltransferase n=1 Tax=unclassified Streptomyces TaxID=2593676 RepID=UPI003435F5B2
MPHPESLVYGDDLAAVYDRIPAIGDPGDTDACVTFLGSLAGAGPVLELAVGTGRVALPLVERGFDVTGVDASMAMVRMLRAKPGGSSVTVVLSDLAKFTTTGTFPLAFIVFDSIALLTTQEEQIQCFRRTADALAAGGLFAVHAYVPRAGGHSDSMRTLSVQDGRIVVQASRHDPTEQRLHSSFIVFENGKVSLHSLPLRYLYPSEMDLMARLAGLRLHQRWGGWQHEPFTCDSSQYVSLYVKEGVPAKEGGSVKEGWGTTV